MDGLTLMAVRRELEAKLVGGRIEKITQPEKYELIFQIHSKPACAGGGLARHEDNKQNESPECGVNHIHGKGGSYRLLFSAAAENARVQLTKAARQNPPDAPPLLMLLRKRLAGGRILGFDQPKLDRVLNMRVSAVNELGDSVLYTLSAEIMGRHSNVILWNEDGVIVECLKHVTALISSVRQVLPGLPYAAPPAQEKLDPLLSSEADFAEALGGAPKPERTLTERFSGISPKAARAVVEGLLPENGIAHAPERAAGVLYKFFQALGRGEFAPTLVLDGASAIAVFPFDPKHVDPANKRAFPSFQEALDAYYERRDERERMQKRTASLNKLLQNALERCEKKLAIQHDILMAENDRERLRLYGELITANLHTLSERQSEALLMNYYDNTELAVPLDATKSPSQNAQAYFKKYAKAKAAYEIARIQVVKLGEERAYLEGQMSNVEHCQSEIEAAEIREELTSLGYIRPQRGTKAAKKKQKAALSKPLRFISSDGLDIYVGKNNRQNDELTLRFAAADDLWLHTKDIAGSHVIVKASSVPEATLREAANLAAYYSRAKRSSQVPVDYALRKYVKKPSGALPGKVIYVNNKTLYVTPNERAALEMRRV